MRLYEMMFHWRDLRAVLSTLVLGLRMCWMNNIPTLFALRR